MVREANNNIGLNVVGVYRRYRYLHLYQVDKSVVVKHSTESGPQIKFKDTEVLGKTSGYMDQQVPRSNRSMTSLK
jgi:hypothetical protein